MPRRARWAASTAPLDGRVEFPVLTDHHGRGQAFLRDAHVDQLVVQEDAGQITAVLVLVLDVVFQAHGGAGGQEISQEVPGGLRQAVSGAAVTGELRGVDVEQPHALVAVGGVHVDGVAVDNAVDGGLFLPAAHDGHPGDRGDGHPAYAQKSFPETHCAGPSSKNKIFPILASRGCGGSREIRQT